MAHATIQPDWNGKAVRYIIDDNGDHVATMIWSHHSQEYQCNWHRYDQWHKLVSDWRKLIVD